MGILTKGIEHSATDAGMSRISRIVNASAAQRSKYLILGSGLAALIMLIPDMYEVDYQGPALNGVNLHGIVGDFSALNGPYDGKPMLASFIFLFLVGLLTRFMDFSTSWSHLSRASKIFHATHHGAAVGANFLGLWSFFKQFNDNALPDVIKNAFVQRAGGGPKAVAETAYLYPSFGLAAILLVLAVGLGLIGVMPLFFGILDALALIFIIVTVGGAAIGWTAPWTSGMVNVATADGRRPTEPGGHCVLAPGHDVNCATTNPTLVIQLPNPERTTVGCTYSITVDWGDRSQVGRTTVHGTAGPTLFTADHLYHGIVGAWQLKVTEKVTAGHCTARPTLWEPEFALGQKT